MPDQVFEIDALMKRAVELLRDRASALPVGTVATELGVPLWAADRALESAYLGRLVRFEAGVGWSALEAATSAPPALDDHRFQGLMQFEGGR